MHLFVHLTHPTLDGWKESSCSCHPRGAPGQRLILACGRTLGVTWVCVMQETCTNLVYLDVWQAACHFLLQYRQLSSNLQQLLIDMSHVYVAIALLSCGCWCCRGLFRNWREVCCLPIPRRKPEPMLMPDLEMGYANQEEAIPALSGPPAYQTGTFCCAASIVRI